MTTKYERQRPRVQAPAVGLSALRRSHGLTQADVLDRIADTTGRRHTVGALSALEGGHRGGSAQFLADIAAVFGLDAADIWTTYEPRAQAAGVDVA